MNRTVHNLVLLSVGILISFCMGEMLEAEDASPAEIQHRPPVSAERPVVQRPVSAQQLQRWVTMLASDKYAEREQAFRRLVDVGYPAVAPLKRQVAGKDLEVSLRALSILGNIYAKSLRNEQAQTQLAVETIIEQIADAHRRTVSQQAKSILQSHSEERKIYAIKRLTKLGALLTFSGNNKKMADFPDQEVNHVTSVILSRRWKGKEPELKLLKRIPELYQTALHLPRGVVMVSGRGVQSPVSETGLEFLKKEFPTANVQLRGSACLGVAGSLTFGNESIVVDFVKPNSAAYLAGIERSDVITHFGGKQTGNFQVLVDAIAEYAPGDKVAVKLRRTGVEKPLEVIVTLQEWKK